MYGPILQQFHRPNSVQLGLSCGHYYSPIMNTCRKTGIKHSQDPFIEVWNMHVMTCIHRGQEKCSDDTCSWEVSDAYYYRTYKILLSSIPAVMGLKRCTQYHALPSLQPTPPSCNITRHNIKVTVKSGCWCGYWVWTRRSSQGGAGNVHHMITKHPYPLR